MKRIEILLKNNTITNKQFNGKTSYKINKKETIYDDNEYLQRTNDSNNNTCNTSDSNVNKNVEFLNTSASPMQVTTPLLITNHCDSEKKSITEQTEGASSKAIP